MNWNFVLSRAQLETFSELTIQRVAARIGRNYRLIGAHLLAWVAVGYGAAAFISLYKKAPELTSNLNVLALCAIVAGVFFYVVRWYGRRLEFNVLFADVSNLRMPQSVIARAEGIEISSAGASSRIEWTRFTDLVEDELSLYFFLDACNAIIIPRSVVSAEDLERLREWAHPKESETARAVSPPGQ